MPFPYCLIRVLNPIYLLLKRRGSLKPSLSFYDSFSSLVEHWRQICTENYWGMSSSSSRWPSPASGKRRCCLTFPPSQSRDATKVKGTLSRQSGIITMQRYELALHENSNTIRSRWEDLSLYRVLHHHYKAWHDHHTRLIKIHGLTWRRINYCRG